MRLLVANRAEIAVRIMATAAALGIETVAVHAADDADCAHVARADRTVRLPGAGPEAYLDVAGVLAAAVDTGCELLHPGYGFLSENAALALGCADSGVGFVGPSAESLALFGDKAAARARAVELGIPVLAATQGPTDLEVARDFIDALGPGGAVMVKAIAGGGGRGMRVVDDPGDLKEAMRRCASEARSAFGDGRVYVEQLLRGARHIEVQVLGDGDAVVALGDRDCSAQRRRQKLIEIAPAPGLPDAVRTQLRHAARRLTEGCCGLATVEFLVAGTEIAFLEVNPRIQVEHTVTEEVTGRDLVELGLRVACGARLPELGFGTPEALPSSRGIAVQVRVNAETVNRDGTVVPGAGALTRFQPPGGRGVRVDTHGYAGYAINPRYDSLLAKVIVHDTEGELAVAGRRAIRALAEFDVAGVPTTIALAQAILARPELGSDRLDTGFVDAHLAELSSAGPESLLPTAGTEPSGEAGRDAADTAPAAPPGTTAVVSPLPGAVVALCVAPGDTVAVGSELLIVEAMKMENVVCAERAGIVEAFAVDVGDTVEAGAPLAFLSDSPVAPARSADDRGSDPTAIRPDLAEVLARRQATLDHARPDAIARRHAAGRRTARENVADLLDRDSFVEYGAFAVAAQRRRRSVEELIARTPADGLITGTGTVHGLPVMVLAYDYTVLAGTQGIHNHRKTDRVLRIAAAQRLPVVIFAEGGGGRPGDTDTSAVAQLDVPTFRLLAELRGRVPTLAIVSGRCFAGNAALAGSCDTIIATADANLGMGGPAMIEGGGLGRVSADEIGPVDVQYANGVIDVTVADEPAAVAQARRYLTYFGAAVPTPAHADQRLLRAAVPENRLRAYPISSVLERLFDTGSVMALRGGFGIGIVTALARLEGRAVGVLANDSRQLGGAIDGDAADKATAFLQLCQARRLPVVSLCDTPGFMVGPAAERTGTVRRFSAMFAAGAALTVPLCLVVLRKAYGLGAMAMAGGDLHAPLLSVAWPTGELGGMGLEGAVTLGFRSELDAIDDPAQRRARFDELVAGLYERGKALSVATVFELDDVIDPADTREIIARALVNRA